MTATTNHQATATEPHREQLVYELGTDAQGTAGLTAPHPSTPGPARLRLRVTRPLHEVTVIHIAGELDQVGTVRLRELLLPRLSSTSAVLVLDLSQVSFVCTAALELLMNTQHRAQMGGQALRLVGEQPCLARALRAGGLIEKLRLYSELAEATFRPVPTHR